MKSGTAKVWPTDSTWHCKSCQLALQELPNELEKVGTARVASWHCKSCQLALQELPHLKRWAGRVLSLTHCAFNKISDSNFFYPSHWDIHHASQITPYSVHSGAMAALFVEDCRRAHLRFLLGRATWRIPGRVAGCWSCHFFRLYFCTSMLHRYYFE